MTLANDIARDLLKIKAVYLKPEEPFTWASGIKSPIYTDNRVTLAYPETRTLIENGFVEKIRAEFPDVEVIAGTATAGIPHGAIIADKMNLPFAYIRSKPKDHGAGNQIEGRVAPGQKMVVIEDLITTGKSSLIAVDVLQKEEVKELEVKSIFSYGFDSAKKNYAKYNCKFSSLSNFDVLIKLLAQTDYLTQDEAKIALEWSKNPEKWGR